MDPGAMDEEVDGLQAALDEVSYRLGDLRQAAGSRPYRTDNREADARRALGLKEIPACPTCKGRHSAKSCPNEVAKKDDAST